MAIQERSLTLRWRINPDTSVTIHVQRNDTVTPHPVVEITLTAQQIVLLQAEHAWKGRGLLWAEEAGP